MRRLLTFGLLISGGGCLMSGNYHSAKTLGKGESQVGLTFSATRYDHVSTDNSTNPPTTTTESIVLPELLPEITYHGGDTVVVTKNGGRRLGKRTHELAVART